MQVNYVDQTLEIKHSTSITNDFASFLFYSGAADDVIIGRYNRKSWVDDDAETIDIEEQILYPLYSSNGFDHDIMLLKLADKSRKPYTKLSQRNLADEDELTVIGFGDTIKGSALVIPNELQEVELKYMTNDDCKDMHGSNAISDDMMCAQETNKDSWYVSFSYFEFTP